MLKLKVIGIACVTSLGLAVALGAEPDVAKQKMFERVFKDAVRLDSQIVARVKAMPPGERLLLDTDGDGKHDEAWFIDIGLRHTDDVKPVLVRVIDEDGDLDVYHGPDLDSDLYIADWHADGTADVVLDYQDNDGDNDLDEMAFYFWMPHHRYFGDNALGVWWGSDDGDDNLLWYDVNYTYYQHLCQYRCHFSGDESFVAFGLRDGGEEWISGWENPFLFYDTDDDRCSEVVLRIEGLGNEVRAIRYSFDADDDAAGEHTHDYDFSITARAEEDGPVVLPAGGVTSTRLRGIPTQSWLQRDSAQAFVQEAQWHSAVLTWDELNANAEGNYANDPHERWEGVIARSSERFRQVGGPACSAFNKRNEVTGKLPAPMRLYYDPADRRLHMKGADEGWLNVDFDLDDKLDARYVYVDEDKDGVFDRRRLDLDGDGEFEFDWPMGGRDLKELKLEWAPLKDFYKKVLGEALMDSQRFIDVAKAALPKDDRQPDPVETFFLTKLSDWMPETKLGQRVRTTPAGARYYMDLLRDRLFARLHRRFGDKPAWKRIESSYAAGDYAAAAKHIESEIVGAEVEPVRSFGGFTRRVPFEWISCRSNSLRHPLSLPLSRIQEAAPDFNPRNCAAVMDQRWIDWLEVPYQVDEADPAVGSEVVINLPLVEGGPVLGYLYYSPTGDRELNFPLRTATAQDWIPPNIGWESNVTAYRAYWGQFDFFGKSVETLIMPHIGKSNYHAQRGWGIDALHVGNTCGIGGLTLYLGDKAYPIWNPAGKGHIVFNKRVLATGPVRTAIETTAENIIPGNQDISARIVCFAFANRRESEVRVTLKGVGDDAMLAPGLMKLDREATFDYQKQGCFGSWGWQQDAIGDIGMGIIIRPSDMVDVVVGEEDRRFRCHLDEQHSLKYWIIGDWRRGRQHPVSPSIENWHRELEELATDVLFPLMISVDSAEDVP